MARPCTENRAPSSLYIDRAELGLPVSPKLMEMGVARHHYVVWNVRIEAYAMGKKHEVWSMMVKGVNKEYEKFTKEEVEFNGSTEE